MAEVDSRYPAAPVPVGPPGAGTARSASTKIWTSTALMEALFALLYIPSLLLIHLVTGEGSSRVDTNVILLLLTLAAYLAAVVAIYTLTVLVFIPLFALTLGRYLDRVTAKWANVAAALLYAGVWAIPGLIVLIPYYTEGVLAAVLVVNFSVVPALAAFGTRMLVPVALRLRPVRVIATVLACIAISLPAIGAVMYGAEYVG